MKRKVKIVICLLVFCLLLAKFSEITITANANNSTSVSGGDAIAEAVGEFSEDSVIMVAEGEARDVEESSVNYDDTLGIALDTESEVVAYNNNGETYSNITITSEDWKYRISENEVATVSSSLDSFQLGEQDDAIVVVSGSTLSLAQNNCGAITKDGSLYMWGRNGNGQVGNGSTEDQLAPVKVLKNVESISLGFEYSGAITKDGSLYMWGDNTYGQVGNGSRDDQTTPVKVLEDVVSISLGENHSGAITKDGSLYMWGRNGNGQVGNGSTEDQLAPVKVLENVESISLGLEYSGAITKDGSLYIWGDNWFGVVGNGDRWDDQLTPVKVLEDVVSISLEVLHSGAITKDGSLYMWGDNSYGQVGNGSTENQLTPVKVLENVESISLGFSHSGAITKDGSLYMWGENKYGQVGNGSTDNQLIPVKVQENVESISLGENHSGAITKDGSLYMWGYNWGGAVGSGRINSYQTTPVKVLGDVVSISLGYIYGGGITKDGSLYMWGCNSYGQVGNGSTEDQTTPVKVLENIKLPTSNEPDDSNHDSTFYFGNDRKYYAYEEKMTIRLSGAFEAVHRGNISEEAEAIVWESSNPLIADIDHVNYFPDTGNIYVDDNADTLAYFDLYLDCYKPGVVTITGTSTDGRAIIETITLEPKLIAGESIHIIDSSNVMLCKVELTEKTDEQLAFLQTFFESLDVNIVKGTKWDLNPDILSGVDFVGVYAQVDAGSVSGRITIKVTSPGGQAVQIDVMVSGNISDNTVVYYVEDKDGNIKRDSRTFNYSLDSCLEKDAAEYNPDLAYMLIALAKSAYHKEGLDFTLLEDADSGTFPSNPLTITESLRNLGFDAENGDVREFNYGSNYGIDKSKVGFTVATKKMSDGTTLISIVVRGSYNLSDWINDFNFINLGVGLHEGFNAAANEIVQELNRFKNDKSISGDKLKYVITGHSRGAAVSNLVAKKLIDSGVSSNNVYNYNFACPDTGRDFAINWNLNGKYNSLYNINNVRDIVGVIPGYLFTTSMHTMDFLFERGLVFWGKYGHTYFFSENWGSVTETTIDFFNLSDQHDSGIYLDYMSKPHSIDSFKTWEQARAMLATYVAEDVWDFLEFKARYGWIFGVFCPVDFEIIDKDGVKIAEVVNNQPQYYSESFGDVVIITAGDQSLVYISGKNDYFVKFTGYATGEMTYCVSDAILGSEYGKEITYTNVSLSQGKTMVSILDNDEQSDKVTLVLFDEELNPVKQIDGNGAEQELSDELREKYSNLPLKNPGIKYNVAIPLTIVCILIFGVVYVRKVSRRSLQH